MMSKENKPESGAISKKEKGKAENQIKNFYETLNLAMKEMTRKELFNARFPKPLNWSTFQRRSRVVMDGMGRKRRM